MLQIEADTVTGQPIKIPFDFIDLSSVPKGKTAGDHIVIKPITVATWFRLKPLLASIAQEDVLKLISDGSGLFTAEVAEVMQKYDILLFEVVCIGIHNHDGNMPAWFKETLKKNCTWKDVFILLNAVLFRLSHNPFMNSITLLKSVSPISEAEIIALQENKDTWNRKAALPFS